MCGGTIRSLRDLNQDLGLSPRVRGNHPIGEIVDCFSGSIPACAGEPTARDFGSAMSGVYPRVCGGTKLQIRDARPETGLSPRVRGNRVDRSFSFLLLGSIPACAGEPLLETATAGELGVYPRVCGGTKNAASSRVPLSGLSPRVRGNPNLRGADLVSRGSIPACAGEPHRCCRLRISDRVYPRVCGGTFNNLTSPGSVQGLSPRVRGNLSPVAGAPQVHGSIPACAGEPKGAWGV